LFVSLFISITLLPVLYRLFHLKDSDQEDRISRFLVKANTVNYEALYESGFRWVMRKQKLTWGIIIVLLMLGLGMFVLLPKTQMPDFSITETLLKIDWNDQINVEENKRRVLELLELVNDDLINNTALVGHQQFLLDKETNMKASETSIYLECKTPESLKRAVQTLSEFITKKYTNALYEYKDVDNIFNLIFAD